MKRKLLKVIFQIVAVQIVLICVIMFWQMYLMQKTLIRNTGETGNKIVGLSGDAMRQMTGLYLKESASMRARIADGEFAGIAGDVSRIADVAEDVCAHPERYGSASLESYDASDMGRIVTYVAYGDNVDPSSEKIAAEVSRLANLQGILSSVNYGSDSVTSVYYASVSGLFVCAEPVSEYNLTEEGVPAYFEARQRPWYLEAASSRKLLFTGVFQDSDTGSYAISCATPVFLGNQFEGVAGAGVILDTIRDDVDGFRVGEKGFACIINDRGQILFSGRTKGALAPDEELDGDLRDSSLPGLSQLAKDAMEGKTDERLVEVDGERYYIAFAPMKTVGWSYLLVLPESEVISPTRTLLAELNGSNAAQNEFVRRSVLSSVRYILLLLLALGAVMFFVAGRFADRLAKPVVTLTDKVRKIEGDNLDFSWDVDTKDEIQILAASFGSMTGRMKDYIADITKITAEKERIGAELDVAARIQQDMLPRIFPAYPDRKEFDLYATMEAAREVGGDFFDYFLVDEDHLALVMADVSGKGVPAALFMVIAKTLIKNSAQSGKSPARVLSEVNDTLCEGNDTGLFVTVWLAVIEISTGKGIAANAGHEHPALRRAGQKYDLVRYRHSPAVATLEGITFAEHAFELYPGDAIFVYTDGVTEANNPEHELFGTDRLVRALNIDPEADPVGVIGHVRQALSNFVNDEEQFDDITMLSFVYYGS